ncbi:MAG: hypothetical protein GY801_18580 [bacterium]|nr:hypothetical protein [bacterium]
MGGLCGDGPGSSAGLQIRESGKTTSITWNSRPIAKLSSNGARYYAEKRRQGYVAEKILFLAAIHWKKQEGTEEYQHEGEAESWFTGLFQIVFAKERSF